MPEIKCKNINCKYNTMDNTCSRADIKFDKKGRCASFEKGFLYYFDLVYDALQNTNFIFMRDLTNDMKIGLVYVMDCFGLSFAVLRRPGFECVVLKDREDEKGLTTNEIKKRKINSKKFKFHLENFKKGILPSRESEQKEPDKKPEEIREKQPAKAVFGYKGEYREYGWILPDGTFFESPFGKHESEAKAICEKYRWTEEYWKWEDLKQDLNGLRLHRDFLIMVKNCCLIHDPTGCGGYIVTHNTPLTEKQKEFLYDYFKSMDDTLRAEEYL